jgi:HEAT repeat protein
MVTVDELIRQLRSESSKKQYEAAIALGQLGDPKAVSALLLKLFNYDENIEVRIAAARSIGQIGDLNVIPDLLDIFGTCTIRLVEPILVAIGEILGRTAPDDEKSREIYSRALDTLIYFAQDDSTHDDSIVYAVAAAKALGKTRDPKAVTALAIALRHSDSKVRSAAQESLQSFALTHPDAILRTLQLMQQEARDA